MVTLQGITLSPLSYLLVHIASCHVSCLQHPPQRHVQRRLTGATVQLRGGEAGLPGQKRALEHRHYGHAACIRMCECVCVHAHVHGRHAKAAQLQITKLAAKLTTSIAHSRRHGFAQDVSSNSCAVLWEIGHLHEHLLRVTTRNFYYKGECNPAGAMASKHQLSRKEKKAYVGSGNSPPPSIKDRKEDTLTLLRP
eukprot:730996-Pelagomonas_calceolata.AAC.1